MSAQRKRRGTRSRSAERVHEAKCQTQQGQRSKRSKKTQDRKPSKARRKRTTDGTGALRKSCVSRETNLLKVTSEPHAAAKLRGYKELLHELNNVLMAIEVNTQLMQWKLGPFDGLKRCLIEIERSALRGAEYVNELARQVRSSEDSESGQQLSRNVSRRSRARVAVSGREPTVTSETSENSPLFPEVWSAPDDLLATRVLRHPAL